MRILQLTTILRYGAGKVVTDLAAQLAKRGHLVQVASTSTPDLPAWTSLIGKLDQSRIQRHELDTFDRSPATLWKSARKLSQIIRDEGIELIHAHSGTPCYLSWLARTFSDPSQPPPRLIGTLHGFTNKPRPHWIDSMDRFAWNQCDQRIAVSKECASIARNKGIDCRQWIRPGLIDPVPQWSVAPPESPGKLVVLNIGELEPRKGQLDLVRASALAANTLNRPIECVLVGAQTDPEYLKQIDTAANSSTLVSLNLPGEVLEPSSFLEKADICVYPSYSEGLGLSIVEAVASSKPVIFSYSSGCRDIADTLGIRSSTFEPGDVSGIADLLTQTLSAPPSKEKLIALAKRAQNQFSSERFCDEYLKAYQIPSEP